MTITEFLQASLAGGLSVDRQKEYLVAADLSDVNSLIQIHTALKQTQAELINLPGAIDICGTGGSGLPRINTSTIASFILAAAGVPIAKHGNKASSGRFGSFDLLEALGCKIEVSAEQSQDLFTDFNLSFLYARHYFPAMRHFTEVRKAIGQPTIFNLLGPLLSPTNVNRQIIGTAFTDKMQLIAQACQQLGKEKAFIINGSDGLDEVTLTGPTKLLTVTPEEITESTIMPADFGVEECEFAEIAGGDAEFNQKIAEEILRNECFSRHKDLVLINAALAFYLVDKVADLQAGYQLAKQTLGSGKPYELLKAYALRSKMPSILAKLVSATEDRIDKYKKQMPLSSLKEIISELPAPRNFHTALNSDKQIIAEIKFGSPSQGRMLDPEFDFVNLAQTYEKNGAAAISVVTESQHFYGSLENLKLIKKSVQLPVLCKDFITDPYHIYLTRALGADAILLIAAILTPEQLQLLSQTANQIGLHVLCEVHTATELETALATGNKIIGINNRNLHNFTVDLQTTKQLIQNIPEEVLVVSESGFSKPEDLMELATDVDAFLIGTELIKSANPGQRLRDLTPKHV